MSRPLVVLSAWTAPDDLGRIYARHLAVIDGVEHVYTAIVSAPRHGNGAGFCADVVQSDGRVRSVSGYECPTVEVAQGCAAAAIDGDISYRIVLGRQSREWRAKQAERQGRRPS